MVVTPYHLLDLRSSKCSHFLGSQDAVIAHVDHLYPSCSQKSSEIVRDIFRIGRRNSDLADAERPGGIDKGKRRTRGGHPGYLRDSLYLLTGTFPTIDETAAGTCPDHSVYGLVAQNLRPF